MHLTVNRSQESAISMAKNGLSVSLCHGANMTTPELNVSQHEIPNDVVCATNEGSDQPAHTRSLIRALASRFNSI